MQIFTQTFILSVNSWCFHFFHNYPHCARIYLYFKKASKRVIGSKHNRIISGRMCWIFSFNVAYNYFPRSSYGMACDNELPRRSKCPLVKSKTPRWVDKARIPKIPDWYGRRNALQKRALHHLAILSNSKLCVLFILVDKINSAPITAQFIVMMYIVISISNVDMILLYCRENSEQ